MAHANTASRNDTRLRPNLRHDAARRRAVARLHDERRGEDRARAPTRAAQRRYHRGRLRRLVARRLRIDHSRRAGGHRAGGAEPVAHGRAGRRFGAARSRQGRASRDSHFHRDFGYPSQVQTQHESRGRARRRHLGRHAREKASRLHRVLVRRRVALRLGLHGRRLQRGDSRRRHRDQPARHHRPRDPRGIRTDVRVHARESSRRRQGHLERALPQRSRPGGREFAGGGAQRRAPDRMHDQRNRRARGQLLDGRSRDGDEDAPRPDGRAVARQHAPDLPGLAPAVAGHRTVRCRPTSRSSATMRSRTKPESIRTAC